MDIMNINKIDDFLSVFTDYNKFYSPVECYLLLIKELFTNNTIVEVINSELFGKVDQTLHTLDNKQLETIIDITQDILQNDNSEAIYSLSKIVHNNAINTKRENIVESLRKNFPLEAMTNWANFVVRDSNWNQLAMYNTNGTQEEYGKRMEQAVHIVADFIKKNPSFDEVCEYSATLRALMAKELNHENPGAFGVKRGMCGPTTPMGGVYKNLGFFLKAKDEEIRKKGGNHPFYQINPCLYNPAMRFGIILGTIGEEKIELSELVFYPRDNDSGSLVHTRQENISLIMKHVEELYYKALSEDDPAKVQENAGKMFWWICQAKPWQRGDPSIAEIIVRSIFAIKQIPNQPWKEGVIPWAEAMKDFNPEEFGNRFANLFAIS